MLTVTAALATLLVCCVPAAKSATTVAALRHQIRDHVRDVEQAKTTLRFFRTHSILLYKWRTKRVAHLERAKALDRVLVGRVILRVLRAKLELLLPPLAAIRLVFGSYADQAIRVSDCETGGTFSVNAQNGQYLGLFQMGSWERARFGHGSTPIEQARAAWRYFVESGRDWSPWECKP